MIVELLESIEAMMMILPMIYFLYLFMTSSFIFAGKRMSWVLSLKRLMCVLILTFIWFSSMVMVLFNTYWISQIWEEYKIENQLDPVLEQLVFTASTFIWMMIALILMYYVWHVIMCRQLIPGQGTVKERLSKIWKELKKKKNVNKHL